MRISFLNFWDSWGIVTETLISYPPRPVADAATDAPTDEETDELISDSEFPDESIDDCE